MDWGIASEKTTVKLSVLCIVMPFNVDDILDGAKGLPIHVDCTM